MFDAIVSTLATGGLSMAGSAYQNYQNKKEANRSRDWQAQMSNTSHRREVEDLRAAGLNPILSANSGASTPPGATPQMENITEGAASTAIDMLRQRAELKAINSQIDVNKQIEKREQATAKNLRDQNAGIKSESVTKSLMLNKVQQGLGFINKAQKSLENPWKKDQQK